MKKTHIVLLVSATVMALAAAYSLAAMSQVYKISFEWYSTYNQKFMSDKRDTSQDRWLPPELPSVLTFRLWEESGDGYLYMDASMGEESSPEYRIKISDIAQRGKTVEVRVALNSPAKVVTGESDLSRRPSDKVRISKAAFPLDGNLLFVYKDNDGKLLYQEHYTLIYLNGRRLP